jgi:hypothetical protein
MECESTVAHVTDATVLLAVTVAALVVVTVRGARARA